MGTDAACAGDRRPDSDKVSAPEGILLRSSAVGYWHGEGTAGSQAPDEVDRIAVPDLVCLPEGPAGARRLLNRGALFLSTTGLPVDVYYPDTGHWLMRNGPGIDETVVLEPADPNDGPCKLARRQSRNAGEVPR